MPPEPESRRPDLAAIVSRRRIVLLVAVVAFAVVVAGLAWWAAARRAPEHPPLVAPTHVGVGPRPRSPSGVEGPTREPLAPCQPTTITTPGAVLRDCDIPGTVTIAAPGVVIENSRIHGNGHFGVHVRKGSVVIRDSEISGFDNGIAFDNWEAHRTEIHSVRQDGVKLGSHTVLADSYIHDLDPAPGAHADGAQLQDGATDVIVRDSTIDATVTGATSAIILKNDLGPGTDGPILIEGNTLDGGRLTLYARASAYELAGVTIRGNRFGDAGEYGYASIDIPVEWADNTDAGTGAQLPLPP